MATIYDEAFSAGMACLLDGQGTSCTYKPNPPPPGAPGVANTTLTAYVGPESAEEVSDDQGRSLVRRRMAGISTDVADPHGGVASPGTRDKLTVDGEDWDVVKVSRIGAGAELALVRVEPIEKSQRGYRRKVV